MEALKKTIEQNPEQVPSQAGYLQLGKKKPGGGVEGTGPHRVKLIGIEEAINKDYKTKEDIAGYNLLFEEEGTPKKYFIPKYNKEGMFHYLVMRFRDIEPGQEMVLEYTKIEGSFKGYIDVKVDGEDTKISTVDDIIPDPEPD